MILRPHTTGECFARSVISISLNFTPTELGDGFIEVHHLAPLFSDSQPRRTTLDDLLLVCSNCHRMIHRTKDVDGNLEALRAHFKTTNSEQGVATNG